MLSLRRLSLLPIVALVITSCASAPSTTSSSSPSSPSSPSSSPTSLATGDEARPAVARARLDELASAWTAFTFANGRCPGSLDEISSSSAPTTDPWGQPLALMPPSAEAAGQIVSAGADGELLTGDDLAVTIRCDAP